MKVVEYDRYGDPSVLVLRERPIPTPRAGQVVVRVRAAALNPKDVLTRAGKYPWLAGRRFPKQQGYDWAGEAAAVGAGVHGVREGDALFGMIGPWRGGACAEYACVRANELAPRPEGLSWEQAAALPLVCLTAIQALRDLGEVAPGHRVLLNGASGGVGVHAIQIAKALGAHVTTLTSAGNAELARSLGADETLDYAAWSPAESAARYDTVFDIFGNRSFAALRPLLTPRGTLVSTVPAPPILLARLRTAFTRPRARLVVVRANRADLRWLAPLISRGALRPVVDRVMPLDDIAAAHAYLATKRARGKVVIRT
jgi:NADPH:quinone reductase-like Zn-dependent oxidoreductase